MKPKSDQSRYIILGSIDGILAVLGVVIGASNVSSNPNLIINAALGGAIALAMTNGLGSYLAESAVEYGHLADLEKPLLRNLGSTSLEKETRNKILYDTLAHGGSSLIGSLVPILPFVFLEYYALEVSVGLSIIVLAALGMFSGKIARQNLILHSVRMVGLGILVVIVVTAFGLT
jgi:predicted membrane protein (TIGR00267 family)